MNCVGAIRSYGFSPSSLGTVSEPLAHPQTDLEMSISQIHCEIRDWSSR